MNRHQLACDQIWEKLVDIKNVIGEELYQTSYCYQIEQILQQTEDLIQEDLEKMSKEYKYV